MSIVHLIENLEYFATKCSKLLIQCMQCGWGASQLIFGTFAGERKGEEGEDSECTFVSLGRELSCCSCHLLFCLQCNMGEGE